MPGAAAMPNGLPQAHQLSGGAPNTEQVRWVVIPGDDAGGGRLSIARMPTIPLHQPITSAGPGGTGTGVTVGDSHATGAFGPVSLAPSAERSLLPCPCQRKDLDRSGSKNFW
jgi:hypothetical protein